MRNKYTNNILIKEFAFFFKSLNDYIICTDKMLLASLKLISVLLKLILKFGTRICIFVQFYYDNNRDDNNNREINPKER